MKLSISKILLFTPKWNDNEKEPETSRIVVRIKNPTIEDKDRLAPSTSTTAVTDMSGKMDHMEIGMKVNDTQIIRDMVVSISNCSYTAGDDASETQIKNAGDLIKAPVDFDGLRKEIVAKCQEILNKADISEKN